MQRLVHQNHVALLTQRAVNFAPAALLFTVAAPAGVSTTAGVIFLEMGNARAGWTHILRHLPEFQAHGFTAAGLQAKLEELVAGEPDSVDGTTYGYFVNNGGANFSIYVVISTNGFIVTAHPYESTAGTYYGATKKSPERFIKFGGLAGYSTQ